MNQEHILAKIKEETAAYQKPSVSLKLSPLEQDDVLASKLMGTPYWEKGVPFPKSYDDEPLQMLAQINLAHMLLLPSFPRQGILQFFTATDDLIGLNFDKPIDHKSSRVVYWPQPDMTKYIPYPVKDWEESPVRSPQLLEAKEVVMEHCGVCDQYNYEQIYKEELKSKFPTLDEDDFFELICDNISNSGSKIGGYAYFTQDDPRSYEEAELYEALGCKKEDGKEFVVLLQLDSDEDVCWGDCGVGNWFILKEDLEKLDFSRVFYTWDCF